MALASSHREDFSGRTGRNRSSDLRKDSDRCLYPPELLNAHCGPVNALAFLSSVSFTAPLSGPFIETPRIGQPCGGWQNILADDGISSATGLPVCHKWREVGNSIPTLTRSSGESASHGRQAGLETDGRESRNSALKWRDRNRWCISRRRPDSPQRRATSTSAAGPKRDGNAPTPTEG